MLRPMRAPAAAPRIVPVARSPCGVDGAADERATSGADDQAGRAVRPFAAVTAVQVLPDPCRDSRRAPSQAPGSAGTAIETAAVARTSLRMNYPPIVLF